MLRDLYTTQYHLVFGTLQPVASIYRRTAQHTCTSVIVANHICTILKAHTQKSHLYKINLRGCQQLYTIIEYKHKINN